jgi:hypothetical protein
VVQPVIVETAGSSETFVFYQTAVRHTRQDNSLHSPTIAVRTSSLNHHVPVRHDSQVSRTGVHSWTVDDAGRTLFVTDVTLFYLTQCEQLTVASRPY